MSKKNKYKNQLEILENLCRVNNIPFTYISYWSGYVELNTEHIKFDIFTLDEITRTKVKVQQFIDMKD